MVRTQSHFIGDGAVVPAIDIDGKPVVVAHDDGWVGEDSEQTDNAAKKRTKFIVSPYFCTGLYHQIESATVVDATIHTVQVAGG